MKRPLTFLVLVAGMTNVQALSITEIMYDPQGSNSGRAWIEVFNDTGSSVALTGWKFSESGVNHGITAYQGGSTIPAGSYAIIADTPTKFLVDYPSYTGILFDSSFSLPVTGEALSLKESSSAIAAFTIDYTPYVSLGGNNDGSTLSSISSSWVRGKATPGSENIAEGLLVDTGSSSAATTTVTENQTVVAQMTPPSADIVMYMPPEKLVVAGASTNFTVSSATRAGKPIDGVRYLWAFGDGGQRTGSSTDYTYAYAGRYIAQVEATSPTVAGTGRTVVRVVPPDLEIEGYDTGKYGSYIDIKNPNSYELDLSQWILSINGSAFPFPKNTLLAGASVTHITGAAMGFASTTLTASSSIKILFPTLEEVTRFAPKESEFHAPQVAGTSTVNVNPPLPKVSVAAKQTGVIKSTLKTKEATTSIRLITSTASKDTRIVSWLRSFFSGK